MKFAPLSYLGAVSSNKPFGFFFWSIFNCLVGKAKLLLESLIFLSSAVTWTSPFSSPPPSLPTDPPLLRAFHPSPRCHVNNYRSLFLPAPSRSSLTFLNAKHLPGVFNALRGLGQPRQRRRHRRRRAPSSSQLLLPTRLQMSSCWQGTALALTLAFILSAHRSPQVWQKHVFSRNRSQFILSFDMLSPTINLTPLLLPSYSSSRPPLYLPHTFHERRDWLIPPLSRIYSRIL